MKLAILRRSATVVAGATAIALISASAALAFTSPGKPPGTGLQNIVWTGQGVTNGNLDSQQCDAANDPLGANVPYLYWVLTPDGGSQEVDATYPILHLGGTGTGDYQNQGIDPSQPQPNAVKFVTPFFPLNGLTANADMNILITGTGSWGLKISHGCSPSQAQPPTVSKDAAGAFHTTWSWNIQKSVDQNRINTPPSQPATFNYTVVVTPSSSNDHITVAGNIDVTNPNGAAITASSVNDQLSNGVGCTLNWQGTPNQLGPGDTTIPYTCSLPDGSNMNGLTNTVTVNWNDQTLGDGTFLKAGNASFTTPNAIVFTQTQVTNDCIDVTDSVAGDLGPVCAAGGPHTFNYPVTYNTAQNPDEPGICTTHHNVATFTTTGPDSSTPAVTGSDHQDVQVCVGAPLNVSKTASPSLTRTYHWGIVKSVDNSHINVPGSGPGGTGPGTATANYTLSITHDNGTDSGWLVKGTITVSNPNAWEDVTVTDLQDAINNRAPGDTGTCSLDSAMPAGGVSIPSGGHQDFAYTCNYTSAPSPSAFTNTATASWDPTAAFTDVGSAQGHVDGDFANAQVTPVGDSATVHDSLEGDLGPFNVSQSSPITLTYPITFNDPSGQCTQHPNLATITDSAGNTTSSGANVQVCVGADLTVTKDAHPSFTRTYTWGIQKVVDNPNMDGSVPATFHYHVIVTHDGGVESNWQVNGTITVTNPNQWEAVPLTSGLDFLGDPNGNCQPAQPFNTYTVPAGGQVQIPYTCTFTGPPTTRQGANNVVVGWDNSAATGAATPDNNATSTANYNFDDPSTPVNIVNGSVDVTDSVDGGPPQDLGPVSYTDPSPKSFDYTRTFSNDQAGHCTPHHNTATFTATDNSKVTGSSSANVSDCIGADLQVSKTATPSFNRQYLWNINKTANPTSLLDGGTVKYTITVNQTGVKDGHWQVTGNITVANPNDWEGVSLQTLTDTVNNGGTCTVGGPSLPLVIAPSGSQVFPYTCSYSSAPSNANGHNTATATWAPAFSPNTSGTGGADFAFGSPTSTTDKTITVTDPQAPSNPLGTVTGTDSSPFASKTFTYTKTFGAPANGCQVINNTATISTTPPQSSSASVNNCTLGALTMGFWQNKNGQAIIGTAGAGSPLATYLTGFNAFKDYPQKSGQTVAQYFTAVFSAANAAGNGAPMLKAQTLATALNVYFWQQIGAPANIGNQLVNVSAWSAAFGGATQLTINQMLAFAANTSSNSGGTSFYGNNKNLTSLAITAFTAVNQDQVSSP